MNATPSTTSGRKEWLAWLGRLACQGLSWCGRERHFVIATAVLVATAGWWYFAKNTLRWALRKEAVAWPASVQVGSDFRLLSLPVEVGPFRRAADGELSDDHETDGQPDGEHLIRRDEMETLGVGTGFDKMRFPTRRSNWFLSRTYRDTRVEGFKAPYGAWRFDVTYYTGGLDTVPHTPETCLVQGGARVLGGSETLTFVIPGQPAPWDKVAVNRIRYEVRRPDQLVSQRYSQYYVFSLNGRPEHDWKKVRLKLTSPWVRYCYFAKVQFVSWSSVEDVPEGDRKAEEFLGWMLPRVLEALPPASEVDAMNR